PGRTARLGVRLPPVQGPRGVPPWLLAATLAALVACVIVALRTRREPGTPETRGSTPPRIHAAPARPSTHSFRLDELGSQVLEAARTGGASETSERFGDYVLLERLGEGGMATVFKAERDGRLCALKRLHDTHLDDAELRRRFAREAELGLALRHPHIV